MACGNGGQILSPPHESKFNGTGKFTVEYPKCMRRYSWNLVPTAKRKEPFLPCKLVDEVLCISLNVG
jgi:hypothetical protein